MAPTYFQIVRHAFERVYDELPTKDRDAKIKAALENMSARYNNVLTLGGPDFADTYCRAAYLFRYVAAHADMVNDAIDGCSELQAVLAKDKVRVSSLGGGPGTDVLAIARHAIENKLASRYFFNLVDREGAWGATWADVDMVLSDHFNSSRTFFDVDVLKQDSWASKQVIFKADVISCSWFLSEISKDLDGALPFFNAMVKAAPSGALLLFVDFSHSNISNFLGVLAKNYGLEQLHSMDYQFRLSSREQKSVLDDFITRFGNGPKLKGKVLIRVLRKP